MPRNSIPAVVDGRASKYRKERMNKTDNKICNGTCPPGLKSRCAGLLLCKENGKGRKYEYFTEKKVSMPNLILSLIGLVTLVLYHF